MPSPAQRPTCGRAPRPGALRPPWPQTLFQVEALAEIWNVKQQEPPGWNCGRLHEGPQRDLWHKVGDSVDPHGGVWREMEFPQRRSPRAPSALQAPWISIPKPISFLVVTFVSRAQGCSEGCRGPAQAQSGGKRRAALAERQSQVTWAAL